MTVQLSSCRCIIIDYSMYVFLFIFCAVMIAIAIAGFRNKKMEAQQKQIEQDNELKELIDQLDYEVEANNSEINIWKTLHQRNLDLGEPTVCFSGHASSTVTCAPWDCPEVGYDQNLIMSAPSHEERIKNAISLLANLETHRVHDICNSAIFFEEARVVFINMTVYSPKDIAGMRSKVNCDDDTVTFTITVNNLLDPTVQITLPRTQEDRFKATMALFRKMK